LIKSLTREKIIDVLVDGLKRLDYFLWMGEFGAAAIDRLDEYLDVDLAVVVGDNREGDVFSVAEQLLGSLSSLNLSYCYPYTSPGQEASFYHLQGTSSYLLLSLTVLEHSSESRFLPEAIQGRPLVYFDKLGTMPCDPLDREELFERIKERMTDMRFRLEHCQVKIFKEINRNKSIEALSMYQHFALWALVDVLPIKYCPLHYRDLTRDIYEDLPPDGVARLEPLFFPTDTDDLLIKQTQATGWMAEAMQSIDLDEVKRLLL